MKPDLKTPFIATYYAPITTLAEHVTQDQVCDELQLEQVLSHAVAVTSSEEFMALLNQARATRTSLGTARNAASSRSHAFFQIDFEHNSTSSSSSSSTHDCSTIDGGTGSTLAITTPGRLLLVDLAGSERAADSLMHNKQQQAESNAINAGLGVLKDLARGIFLVCKQFTVDSSAH
eukprot:gene4680-4933_t